jgi:hypothetical protein
MEPQVSFSPARGDMFLVLHSITAKLQRSDMFLATIPSKTGGTHKANV